MTTVVLVHGAWSGAWIWDKVVAALRADRVDVLAVDLPTCRASDTSVGVDDDIRHVRDVLLGLDGTAILVGNSYGGVVISGASVANDRVERLVYIAAAIPAIGEPVFAGLAEASSPEFAAGITMRPDGLMSLDPEVGVRTAFSQASGRDHDVWRNRCSPAMSFGSDPSFSLCAVGWQTVPTTYVVCEDDRAIDPQAQRRWARERASEVRSWPTDHCPQVSRSDLVADLLEELVRVPVPTGAGR